MKRSRLGGYSDSRPGPPLFWLDFISQEMFMARKRSGKSFARLAGGSSRRLARRDCGSTIRSRSGAGASRRATQVVPNFLLEPPSDSDLIGPGTFSDSSSTRCLAATQGHPTGLTNPGMPVWWPGFCGTIDIVLGGWLAIRLWKARNRMAAGERNDHTTDAE